MRSTSLALRFLIFCADADPQIVGIVARNKRRADWPPAHRQSGGLPHRGRLAGIALAAGPLPGAAELGAVAELAQRATIVGGDGHQHLIGEARGEAGCIGGALPKPHLAIGGGQRGNEWRVAVDREGQRAFLARGGGSERAEVQSPGEPRQAAFRRDPALQLDGDEARVRRRDSAAKRGGNHENGQKRPGKTARRTHDDATR